MQWGMTVFFRVLIIKHFVTLCLWKWFYQLTLFTFLLLKGKFTDGVKFLNDKIKIKINTFLKNKDEIQPGWSVF